MKAILFATLCAVALVHAFGAPSCTDTDVLGLSADALQWNPSDWSPISVEYKEWWFFTVHDPEQRFGAVFGYSVADPSQAFGRESSSVAAMVWPSYEPDQLPSPCITPLDIYNYTQYSGNRQNASLSVGDKNHITTLSEGVYQIDGAIRDGSVIWSLRYTQESYPSREVFQPPGMQLDWISFMPAASVSGFVTVNGKTFNLSSAIGYHDHNWGAWPDTLFNWIWAQFSNTTSERAFALVLGGYHVPVTDTYIGYVFVRYNGQRFKLGTLCGDKFELTPLQFLEVDGRKYSVHNRVQVTSAAWRLTMEYRARVGTLNPSGRGLGLYVDEQISDYSVQLYKATDGGWTLVEDLSGTGFSEWSHSML
jgi:hypothetical protein